MEKYEAIAGLEPQDVLRCFWKLSEIPREPGYKRPSSDFILQYARSLGLEAKQDESLNVIVHKPATKGYENAPVVMLQAHLDMVCEVAPGVVHDFKKDPLKLLVIDGDKVQADGTSLGADDGLGVAIIMAILADRSLHHPALEAVFTTDEETDMNGAFGLDFSQFKSRFIINLDSEAVQVCGAGEMEVCMELPHETEPLADGSAVYALEIGGLMGGHSGAQAMQELGNAVTLLSRILCALEKETSFQLVSFTGGHGFSTSFARNATALLAFDKSQLNIVQKVIATYKETFKQELRKRDPDVTVTIEPHAPSEKQGFSSRVTKKLLTLLTCLPDGICSLNRDFPGAMESCSNVGVVETHPDRLMVAATIRSVAAPKKYYLYDKMARLCAALEINCAISRDLPQWDYSLDDDLLKLIGEIYPDCTPTLAQGTLEAGIFCTNMPGVSFVALAPPYYNAHSPNEYFLASECAANYQQLKTLLRRLK